MGCTRSKLEPDDDDAAAAAAAAGAGTSRSGRRPRGADVSGRKGGFVAAAELLRLPEEPDEGGGAESPETEGTKGDAEGEERRGSGLGLGLGFVGHRKRGAAEEEDDLPGSPSFRFYFKTTPLTGSGNGDDDDSAESENGKDKPDGAKGKDNSHRQEECAKTLKTDEESECKSQRREKAWRFKVLTKKNSDAHNNS
uniref:Uncharacterized protein n=1 Tax=Ananas comosus var. bracteatus TaxID=296719 RepID=A0A6V7P0H8_ANACO|nr:unnamed protein product [Ananas comosus var. bracteatus]